MEKTNDKYILQFNKLMTEASSALKNKNFLLYDGIMAQINEEYKKYKKDCELTYNCSNFGMANYIFEDALPTLFKKNKKAVKEFIKTIKEDKNLLSQFQFYKALEKNNDSIDTKDYITESINILKENVNKKTLKESNKKLFNIIKKYDIKPEDKIPTNMLNMFESCDYVFSHDKKLTNLLEMNDNINNIVNFTKENYNALNEEHVNTYDLIENFDKKYSNILTEEEKDFARDIMSFKSKDNSLKKEKLFNKFKNECIKTIDKLISESNDSDKEGLYAIKEQIENKVFCEDTIVKDMAKLLEIRDILLSE